jgi:hypothetical protein
MKIAITVITLVALLTSCANNAIKTTGNPEKTITLEKAFESVGKSLRVLDEATGDKMFGIAASEIEVTFNISNTAVDNKGVNISIPVLAKAQSSGTQSTYSGGGSGDSSGSNATANLNENSMSAHSNIKGSRENKVTVKFESILKLMKDLDIEKIKLLREMGYFDKANTRMKSHTLMFDKNKMVIDPLIEKK